MSRPKLLDLYACAGGAGMGYHRAETPGALPGVVVSPDRQAVAS